MQDETSGSRILHSSAEPTPAADKASVDVSRDEWCANAQPRRLRRHQRITPSGSNAVYYVKSGMLALESRLPSGARVLIELLYPGDVFSMSNEQSLPGMAFIALSTAEVLKLSKAHYVEDIGGETARIDRALHTLQMQRSRAQLHVAVTSMLTSEERVTALLIEFANRFGTWSDRHVTFWLPLSRTDIANYLALNPDTLSRIMSRLKARKLIERTGRSLVRIKDWQGLLADCPLSESVCLIHRRLKS